MKLENKDLLFIGATVKMGKENYTIVKINEKSFYAAPFSYQDYITKLDMKTKGVTLKKFFDFYGIKMYKYDGKFEIEENEFNRKAIVEANMERNNYKMDSLIKSTAVEKIAKFSKKKKNIRFFQFVVGNKKIRFVEKRENCYLMNIHGDYVMCCFDTEEYVKIGTVYDYSQNYKEIPWDKLSKFQTQEVAVA